MDADSLPRWEVAMPFRTFLTIETCPPRWKHYDLYLFRDPEAALVFYVGQSYCAFERVWEHIRGGPKGHSMVGRFLLCNWPRSARFEVRLLDSRAPRFAGLWQPDQGAHALDGAERALDKTERALDKTERALDGAERALIEEMCPCLNVALNQQPQPLPPGYLPPNAPLKHLHSYRRMLREAARAAQKLPEDLDW